MVYKSKGGLTALTKSIRAKAGSGIKFIMMTIMGI